MSTPQISERMQQMVIAVANTNAAFGKTQALGGYAELDRLESETAEGDLLNAIAELEWENAALRAYRDSKSNCHHSISGIARCDACYSELQTERDQWRALVVAMERERGFRGSARDYDRLLSEVMSAREALGPKWNEAMEEKKR